MEENIIVVGKSSLAKKVFGIILLLPVAYFYIMGIIVLVAANAADVFIFVLILSIPFVLIALACLKQSSSITVTDKRVFGQVTRWFFSTRQLELPLDSITSVATGFNSISISTPSGVISFKGITNQDEVANAVTGLLMARQSAGAPVVVQESRSSVPEELKQYKELLDSGVITQQEFDEKKRQLLGL